MFLKNLPKEELAQTLRPTFDSFAAQLTPDLRAQVSFDTVVSQAYQLLRGQSVTGGPSRDDQIAAATQAQVGVSPCVMAVGMVVADSFAILFQLAGINESESRAAARAILEELGQETIRGIQATIHDFNAASSTVEKAKLMWKIISETYNAVGVSGITKALKDSMHWYDWVITGVTVVAQLVAWFGTDGAALVAELALEGAYIAQFTEDVVEANSACA